ncbi:MAG: hypothetical protein KVP17_001742 [Porospora cf. gigantea B]|uniref:uncharacterized protein n=1 Tax=Porospora cf. gigantea B TaxID=2853592 RepID=UPI003571CA18|nr:MAG: hypothetical protein KVP17_001742 [Porospora cf. gigantea B]
MNGWVHAGVTFVEAVLPLVSTSALEEELQRRYCARELLPLWNEMVTEARFDHICVTDPSTLIRHESRNAVLMWSVDGIGCGSLVLFDGSADEGVRSGLEALGNADRLLGAGRTLMFPVLYLDSHEAVIPPLPPSSTIPSNYLLLWLQDGQLASFPVSHAFVYNPQTPPVDVTLLLALSLKWNTEQRFISDVPQRRDDSYTSAIFECCDVQPVNVAYHKDTLTVTFQSGVRVSVVADTALDLWKLKVLFRFLAVSLKVASRAPQVKCVVCETCIGLCPALGLSHCLRHGYNVGCVREGVLGLVPIQDHRDALRLSQQTGVYLQAHGAYIREGQDSVSVYQAGLAVHVLDRWTFESTLGCSDAVIQAALTMVCHLNRIVSPHSLPHEDELVKWPCDETWNSVEKFTPFMVEGNTQVHPITVQPGIAYSILKDDDFFDAPAILEPESFLSFVRKIPYWEEFRAAVQQGVSREGSEVEVHICGLVCRKVFPTIPEAEQYTANRRRMTDNRRKRRKIESDENVDTARASTETILALVPDSTPLQMDVADFVSRRMIVRDAAVTVYVSLADSTNSDSRTLATHLQFSRYKQLYTGDVEDLVVSEARSFVCVLFLVDKLPIAVDMLKLVIQRVKALGKVASPRLLPSADLDLARTALEDDGVASKLAIVKARYLVLRKAGTISEEKLLTIVDAVVQCIITASKQS